MDNVVTVSASSTSWGFVATDGSLYASLAALQAAGKKAWPNGAFDPGIHAAHLIIANQSSADTASAGSGCFFAVNRGAEFSGLANDAARDAQATPVFSGQTFSFPGQNPVSVIPIENIAVRKVVSSDLLTLTAITG